MSLDRRILTKIDRCIFSEFDRADSVQLAKIPVSDVVWSTWRRYCDVVGVTMGQGIAGLVVRELGTVVGSDADAGSVLGAELERRLTERTEEQRLLQTKRSPLTPAPKVGRNEWSPCGSGRKYEHCHGLSTRETNDMPSR